MVQEQIKGLIAAIVGITSAVGVVTTYYISKFMKSSMNDKKDELSPEINPESDNTKEEEKDQEEKEEYGGFETWYKNSLLISSPVDYYCIYGDDVNFYFC